MTENVPKMRMRLRFTRSGTAAGMSHLEQIKTLRNMVRVSGLEYWPVGGRGQMPKMAFGPAISLGYYSECEYADLYLAQRATEETVARKLASVAADGVELRNVKRVPILFPSIESCVSAVEYWVSVRSPEDLSQEVVDAFLRKDSALYEKEKAEGPVEVIDVRRLVLSAAYASDGILKLVLRFEPSRNVKPEIVLNVITARPVEVVKVTRKELFWQDSKGSLEVF